MDAVTFINNIATVDELMLLHEIGFDFPCGDGRVIEINSKGE